jgi:hypothetical protein
MKDHRGMRPGPAGGYAKEYRALRWGGVTEERIQQLCEAVEKEMIRLEKQTRQLLGEDDTVLSIEDVRYH